MKILQRNLYRNLFVVWEMKGSVSVVRFKFRCNILISGKIIKGMPGSVASGTPCIYIYIYTYTHTWAAGLSRYSNWLRDGRSGIESRWELDFPPFQTGPEARPASCKMGAPSSPGVKSGRSVLLTTHYVMVIFRNSSLCIYSCNCFDNILNKYHLFPDMLSQHLVCKNEWNCEYCNITLARKKKDLPDDDLYKIETCRNDFKCFWSKSDVWLTVHRNSVWTIKTN